MKKLIIIVVTIFFGINTFAQEKNKNKVWANTYEKDINPQEVPKNRAPSVTNQQESSYEVGDVYIFKTVILEDIDGEKYYFIEYKKNSIDELKYLSLPKMERSSYSGELVKLIPEYSRVNSENNTFEVYSQEGNVYIFNKDGEKISTRIKI